MEVATGDIKAISNLERNADGTDYIEALNYSVVGFEPGSVVKPISMMIALEDGLVDNLEEVIPIGASWAYAGGRPITDSHYNGSLRVREVIEQSSNIGMARIITRGYDKNPKGFVERLRSIGFLEPMNTGIAGERVPYFNPEPGRVDLSRMCYGYASQIPPIYTLSIYNAIANNGKYVRPRLVSSLVTEDFDSVIPVSYIRDRICSEENARKMQYMLKQVVWAPRHRPLTQERQGGTRRQDRHMLLSRPEDTPIQHGAQTPGLLRLLPGRQPQILLHGADLLPQT